MKLPYILLIPWVALMLLLPALSAHAASDAIVLGQIGENAPQAWSFLRQYFEEKGYQVVLYQRGATIEQHVEEVNGLNRGPAKVFLSLELVPAPRTHILVAMTDAKKGEGRFLTIDQIPAQFAEESERLAGFLAGQFSVKMKHLPLFPLLGLNMPGVFVQVRFKEGELEDTVAKLESGVHRYFRERATR